MKAKRLNVGRMEKPRALHITIDHETYSRLEAKAKEVFSTPTQTARGIITKAVEKKDDKVS